MTQPAACPTPSAAIAPTLAAAAPNELAPDAEAAFAAVLQAQIGLPALPAAEILAAPLPPADSERPAQTTDPDATELAALLAGLMPAAPAPPAAAATPVPATVASSPAAFAVTAGVAAPPAGRTDVVTAPAAEGASGKDGFPDAAAAVAATRSPGRPDGLDLAVAPAGAQDAAEPPQPTTTSAPHAASPNAAQAVAPAAHARHAEPAAPSLRIDAALGSRGWDAELGQKLVLLVNRQESRAELTLTPPQLGRIEVSIAVNGEQTNAAFVCANAAAREALEQALPRLREVLAAAGIDLGQASVSAESAGRDAEHGATHRQAEARAGRDGLRTGTVAITPRRGVGLIDTFA
jgi:flagellar hook-length control protein FliK